MPEPPGLERRLTADGSPTLFSQRFQETFHSSAGARLEADQKYVLPAQLERWPSSATVQVVDVGVGLGYNSAALIEAASDRGLQLQWWGLELDPEPLTQALADPDFCSQWRPTTLELLQQLLYRGVGAGESSGFNGTSNNLWNTTWHCALGQGELLWGDGRVRLPELLGRAAGQCDLVLLDAFSPRRCPQLWTLEFLTGLAQLLSPSGRILTYCSAAAVRQSLRQIGLQLAAIQAPESSQATNHSAGRVQSNWSLGTAASWQPLPVGGGLRELSAMEWDHLSTQAAEPYRDPSQTAEANAIFEARQRTQAASSAASTSAWRRRWGT